MHKSPSSQADGLRTSRSHINDNSVHAAALLSAASAFGKQPTVISTPRIPPKGNGALLAASLAGQKPPAVERSLSNSSDSSVVIGRLGAQSTGSTAPRASPLPSPAYVAGSSGWLDTKASPSYNTQQSASYTAAIAAVASAQGVSNTSRDPSKRKVKPSAPTVSPSTIRKTTFELPTVTLHEASPIPAQTEGGMDRTEKGTDDTPIAPTTSLVKLFEQNGVPQAKRRPVTAPKPTLPATPTSKTPVPQPKPKISPRLEALKQRQQYDEAVAAEEAAKELRGRPVVKGKPSFKRSSSATVATVATPISVLKARPDLPPPRRAANKAIPSPSKDPQKSPPAKSPTFPKSPPLEIRKTSSNLSLPETFDRSSLSPSQHHYQHMSMRQISPHITGDSLANAIVGANLASRQNSPHRSGTPSLPPLPSRGPRNHNHNHIHPPHYWRTRSSSPAKSVESTANHRGMLRSTMRKEASSSSDEGRGKQGKGRKHRFRKHPNKHHEGDRKRWRDSITERERKRYEGLWAANKGLWISAQTSTAALASSSSLNTLPTEDVLDLVVREIWGRSRLPSHVLGDIWELVDHRGVRRLTREEFVVGTWLVDQSLKGRKVPSRVMDSVWVSVRLMGVKVRKKNFH